MSSMANSKRWGQNFFRSPARAASLIAGIPLATDATVLEIGPGRGILTRELAARVRRVVAVERDPALVAILRREFAGSNIRVVCADFRTYPLPSHPYTVVANLPFGVTAAVVTKLFRASLPPDATHLVLQREAAEKYAGVPHETQASVLLKPWFALTVPYSFARSDFVPVPRVEAALLSADKRTLPLVAVDEAARYRAFVLYGYNRWRGSTCANFRPVFSRLQWAILARTLSIAPEATPTQMTFAQWLGLFAAFRTHVPERKRQAVLAWVARHDLPAWLAVPPPLWDALVAWASDSSTWYAAHSTT